MPLALQIDRPDLRYKRFTPNTVVSLEAESDIFFHIRRGDILLHHPYDNFQTVVDFLAQAAEDPHVLAIKQTLYRTSSDSPFVQELMDAARNGKQVTVVIELKARFDEAANIKWARLMREAGVDVVYGVTGLKTHAKATLIVRSEGDGIRRYAHLGTGNYHPSTAKFTRHRPSHLSGGRDRRTCGDLQLPHRRVDIARDAGVAGSSFNLYDSMQELIDNEIEHAQEGEAHGIYHEGKMHLWRRE